MENELNDYARRKIYSERNMVNNEPGPLRFLLLKVLAKQFPVDDFIELDPWIAAVVQLFPCQSKRPVCIIAIRSVR